MRQELKGRILMLMQGYGIPGEIDSMLTVLLNDYEITGRTTEVAVCQGDKNEKYLERFILAKSVKGCTERTLKLYAVEIRRILQVIAKPADEITADDIRYYLAVRERRDKISRVTAGNELRYLRTFFAYLHTEEMILRDPTAKIDAIRGRKAKKPAFTEMDVELIRQACRTARETAVIEILLSTGCRLAELVQMQACELEQDRITVHGKGEKDRMVYLNAKAQIAVRSYLSERGDANPYLFPGGFRADGHHVKGDARYWYRNPENVCMDSHAAKDSIGALVSRIGRRAGVKNVHPHRFRRTCATFALRRGMPIEQVSKMLGHEQLGTTQIYLDLSENELEQAHKKYVV